MTVTMKVLSETISIADVEKKAKEEWLAEVEKSRKLPNRIVRAIPAMLVIVAVAFYLLSAPHTAHVLNLITPGWGRLAPIGWEFGILVIAAVRAAGLKNPATWWLLFGLIAMSIVINVTGGFMAIIEQGGQFTAGAEGAQPYSIQGMTMVQLLGEFGKIPAGFQVAMFIVVPIGIVVPLIAAMVGHIIIGMALNHIKLELKSDEQRWKEEAEGVMYNALFNEALQAGATAKIAANWAQSVSEGMYAYIPHVEPQPAPPQPQRVPTAPAMGFPSALQKMSNVQSVQPVQVSNDLDSGQKNIGHGRGYSLQPDASERVRAYLDKNPMDINLPVRVLAAKIGVGKSTVSNVIRERRKQ